MTMLKAGEKLVVCQVCEDQKIFKIKETVTLGQCERCHNAKMRVVKVRPTNVSGVGRNEMADLGLVLLLEAGADAPDIEENLEFS